MPRKANVPPRAPKRRLAPLTAASRASSSELSSPTPRPTGTSPEATDSSSDDVFLTPCADAQELPRFSDLAGTPVEPTLPRAADADAGARRVLEPERICAVVSTLPKCEQLDRPSRAAAAARPVGKDPERARSMKIYRMPSESDDFETNSFERQKRHLTCQPRDITFALNLNLSNGVDAMVKQDQETARLLDSGPTADTEPGPLDTEVLLQKVSDTLSSSLPLDEEETDRKPAGVPRKKIDRESVPKESEKGPEEAKQDSTESSEAAPLNNSGGSGRAASQQDTSDYVSAVDGDLSIPDWEYQLPAPPSAFRDAASPAPDECDTITLGSLDAFKEPIALILDEDSNKSSRRASWNKTCQKAEKPATRPKSSDSAAELKKEVICELEDKIGSGALPQGAREPDARRVDDLSAPRVAPADNTLANFTITTYSRPKSVNIFDEVDRGLGRSDDRFMKSFPTLARNRTNRELESKEAATRLSKPERVSPNDAEPREPEPKTEEVAANRQTEKPSVQRSKSYISSSDWRAPRENDAGSSDGGQPDMRKSTSTANLASPAKGNEKFSQWRENILKRQEEPTKERQLQSLQVLRSILPQLKSAQQPEEDVSKESSEAVLAERFASETRSAESSVEPTEAGTRESRKSSESAAEAESRRAAEPRQLKKYSYSGPPAISLGSWSERPTLNVQIKKDTDYKFGGVQRTIGGRTIVSLNGMSDDAEPPKSERSENLSGKEEIVADKKSPKDPARKLISHTTASAFKKPVLSRVGADARPPDKPVVTGVELKRTLAERSDANKNDESAIDTSPVDFRELSRAFGQDVCLRPKPRRLNPNRRTEHFGSNPDSLRNLDALVRQNGHGDVPNGHSTPAEATGKPGRFTSVVGITQNSSGGQGTGFQLRGGVAPKSSAAMPVVKGFRISGARTSEPQKLTNGASAPGKSIPKPPTMPVITGVTLKSARPKSMPVQVDQRDMLLESIRNFGGRENLKSASGRC